MAAGRKQKVAIGIGKPVQKDDGLGITKQEEVLFVKGGRPWWFKEAATAFRCGTKNMFHAPGRPKRFHVKRGIS